MIGVVVVTHGRVGEELMRAMAHIMGGPQSGMTAVSVFADDDLDELRSRVAWAVESVDAGQGVVLLTDMLGSSPGNLCVAQMTRPDLEVLGGVNLPMLVKLAKIRPTATLADAVLRAQDAARKYIGVASDAFPQCRAMADQLLRRCGPDHVPTPIVPSPLRGMAAG